MEVMILQGDWMLVLEFANIKCRIPKASGSSSACRSAGCKVGRHVAHWKSQLWSDALFGFDVSLRQ